MQILTVTLFIINFVISSTVYSQVIDTSKFTSPDLMDGQCHSIADSKVYLSSLSNDHLQWKELKTQLNPKRFSQLKNTDETSWYFCKLLCSLNHNKSLLWIALTDRNENFKNMNGFVCPFLSITDVQATSTLSITTTIAKSFWAADSNLIDLNYYLVKENYKISDDLYQMFLKNFKTKGEELIKYYLASQNSEMVGAAKIIDQWIHAESIDSVPEMKERISYLISIHWDKKIELKDYLREENLVDSFLIQNARFFQFIKD